MKDNAEKVRPLYRLEDIVFFLHIKFKKNLMNVELNKKRYVINCYYRKLIVKYITLCINYSARTNTI